MDLEKIYKDAGAYLEGHFLLSSGNHSQFYLQSAKVLEDPALAAKLADELARVIEKFGLKFESEFKGLQGKFKFLLTPKNGEISSLGYEILLTRPQTNKDNKTLSASWQENELVSESVGLKEGRWQLLLRLSDKQDTRYYKFDFNATK